jgi:hypothetical protein
MDDANGGRPHCRIDPQFFGFTHVGSDRADE